MPGTTGNTILRWPRTSPGKSEPWSEPWAGVMPKKIYPRNINYQPKENSININELKKSSFLKKEDVGDGALCTIATVEEVNIAKDGAPEEMKWALHVDEYDKPLILNSTNGQIIAKITGSEESDEWSGHKIVLYHDPNVSFGGKLIGGIRVRAPKAGAGKKPTPQPEPDYEAGEEPF